MNCIHKHSVFITLLKIIFNIYLLDNVYKMNKKKDQESSLAALVNFNLIILSK